MILRTTAAQWLLHYAGNPVKATVGSTPSKDSTMEHFWFFLVNTCTDLIVSACPAFLVLKYTDATYHQNNKTMTEAMVEITTSFSALLQN